MDESVFGPGMDLQAYISKRALEIQDLRERKVYRDVTEKLMLELFQHLKDEQAALEKRIFDELKSERSKYAIYIGLSDLKQYDANDEFLAPINDEDVKRESISLSEACSNISPQKVGSFFLQQDAQEVQRFAGLQQTYFGEISTKNGTYQARFQVEQDKSYLKRIEALYRIFHANHIPWVTICTAYLMKMFNVYLADADGAAASSTDEILKIEVDFGAYNSFVHWNMVPLWNLTPVSKNTSIYPVPCADHIHYEHKVFAHRLKPGCHYLSVDSPHQLQSIRLINQDLVMICESKQPVAWKLYQVNPRPVELLYKYPVLSNQPIGRFADDLNDYYRQGVKTTGELRRIMEGYEYTDILSFQGVELIENWGGESGTYDMDQFITDELRIRDRRETLVLRFLPTDPENYMNTDIMSFLVTQAQKLFPEYNCKGVLA